MGNKIKAVFFDMGETLYTYKELPLSWKDHFRDAWHESLTTCGYSPSEDLLRDLSRYMSKFNTREVAREIEFDSEHILGGALESVGYELKRFSCITSSFFNYFRRSLAAYPETVEALVGLRERSVYIGALTDVAYGMPREFVADDLNQVGILNLLDNWKTSVDIGYRKPNPKGLAVLCAEAGCNADEALYVGNERKDVDVAENAGLVSVLIHRSSMPIPDWGQSYTISSLLDCPTDLLQQKIPPDHIPT